MGLHAHKSSTAHSVSVVVSLYFSHCRSIRLRSLVNSAASMLNIQLVRCNFLLLHVPQCMEVDCAWAVMRKECPVSGVLDHGVMGGYWSNNKTILIKGCNMQLKRLGSA